MIKHWFRREDPARLRVLMVCMGNLCRSPMAEAVLRTKLAQAGMVPAVAVDSAGTHGFHKGSLPDPRAISQAAQRGYSLDGLKSRPLVVGDFNRFDLVLAMDHANLDTLRERCSAAEHARLRLLLSFSPAGSVDEVPDPYYGSVAGFDHALNLIEPACDGLLHHLRRQLAASS